MSSSSLPFILCCQEIQRILSWLNLSRDDWIHIYSRGLSNLFLASMGTQTIIHHTISHLIVRLIAGHAWISMCPLFGQTKVQLANIFFATAAAVDCRKKLYSSTKFVGWTLRSVPIMPRLQIQQRENFFLVFPEGLRRFDSKLSETKEWLLGEVETMNCHSNGAVTRNTIAFINRMW